MNPNPPTDHLKPMGGARFGAGRKPELSTEQHQKNNAAWGETVVAATLRIRDLMMNLKWDATKLTPTQKFRLMMAWNIVNKHFPTTSPDSAVNVNIGTSSEEMVKAYIKIADMINKGEDPTPKNLTIDVEEIVNWKLEGEE